MTAASRQQRTALDIFRTTPNPSAVRLTKIKEGRGITGPGRPLFPQTRPPQVSLHSRTGAIGIPKPSLCVGLIVSRSSVVPVKGFAQIATNPKPCLVSMTQKSLGIRQAAFCSLFQEGQL